MEDAIRLHCDRELATYDDYLQRGINQKLHDLESKLRAEFSLQLEQWKEVNEANLDRERSLRSGLKNELSEELGVLRREIQTATEDFGGEVSQEGGVAAGQHQPRRAGVQQFPEEILDQRILQKLTPLVLELEQNLESLVELPLQKRLSDLEVQLVELESRAALRDDAFSATLMDLERAVDGIMREGEVGFCGHADGLGESGGRADAGGGRFWRDGEVGRLWGGYHYRGGRCGEVV